MIIFQYNCWEDIGFVLKIRLAISYMAFLSLGDYKYPPNIPKLKLQPPTVMTFVVIPLLGYEF